MKLPLQNYICAGRHSCKNINTENCKSIPKKKERFIECDYYEARKHETL